MTRNEIISTQQALTDLATAENRDLTAEENARFEDLQKSLDSMPAEEEEKPVDNTRAIEEERTRAAEINELCREFDMNADEYIKKGAAVDAVRAAIIEKMKNENKPVNTRGVADISVTASEEDKFRSAAADALVMRGGVSIESPSEGARDLRGLTLRNLAIDTLRREGNEENLLHKSSDELFNMLSRTFYNPTASFPSILDTAINKAYVEGHKTANVTFDRFCKKGTLSDFKINDNNYLAGPAGEFKEVPEGGEIEHDLPLDVKKPTRQLKTYGRQFTMTRQAFINDDIGFLSTVPARYAASARKTINKQVYQIMINNPAIYDGTELFSKAHKNVIATGTGITRESLQSMIMALQTQVDEFGDSIIVNPATLVVPSGYAFDVYTILYSQTINTTTNTQAVNPLFRYKEMIDVVEDPTINVLAGGFGNVMPWFLIGANSDTDFIQVDYLNGEEVPTIRRMETPGTLGFVWDIYLDWGINVMDFRGAVKNPGIKVESPLGA